MRTKRIILSPWEVDLKVNQCHYNPDLCPPRSSSISLGIWKLPNLYPVISPQCSEFSLSSDHMRTWYRGRYHRTKNISGAWSLEEKPLSSWDNNGIKLPKNGHSEDQGFFTEALRTINPMGSMFQIIRLSILKKQLNLSCWAREGDRILEHNLLEDCLSRTYIYVSVWVQRVLIRSKTREKPFY